MDIPTLLHELFIVPDIEIVIALLPEMLGGADQASRHALLQRFEGIGKKGALGFAHQQVDVLGHDYICVNAEPEIASDALQCSLEDSLGGVGHKQGSSAITGKSDEMTVTGLLKSF